MFHDPVLLAGVANGGLLPGEVACCAQRGDISRIRRRGGIELAQGAMRAVAVPAEGRVGTTLRSEGAVRALAVLAHGLFVANGAIHLVPDGAAGSHVGRGPAGM